MKSQNIKASILCLFVVILTACANKPAYQSSASKQPKKIVSPAERGIPQRYLVQSGDTVAKIANRYGLNWRDISTINNLDSNHTIYAGRWITLWNAGGSYTPTTNTRPASTKPQSNQSYTGQPQVVTIQNPSVGSVGVMQFRYPVGRSNRIARHFGTVSRVDGIDTKSEGMWFLGTDGDAVTASRSGRVIHVDNARTGGSLIISHDDGFASHYLHVKDIAVSQGQDVEVGKRVASMRQQNNGATVLEFRIARHGVYVDPLTVLK